MLRALFLDLYGTAVQEMGPIALDVCRSVCQNGTASSVREVLQVWWADYNTRLAGANGPDWRSQHDLALESFRVLVRHFQADCDPAQLLEQMEIHWGSPPIYPDTKDFLARVSLPVWFVTNSDDAYARACVRHHDLPCAGLVTSQQARYAKPHPELFRHALRQAGLAPEDVIHIGDSLTSDLRGAASAGISGIWLNREGKPVPEGIRAVSSLFEVLPLLV